MKYIKYAIFTLIFTCCKQKTFIQKENSDSKYKNYTDSIDNKKTDSKTVIFWSDFLDNILNNNTNKSIDSVLYIKGYLDDDPTYKIKGLEREFKFNNFLKEELYNFNEDSIISKNNLNKYFEKVTKNNYFKSNDSIIIFCNMEFKLKKNKWVLYKIYTSNNTATKRHERSELTK